MTTRFMLVCLILAFPVAAAAQRLTLGASFGGSYANGELGATTGWKSGWSADAIKNGQMVHVTLSDDGLRDIPRRKFGAWNAGEQQPLRREFRSGG